MPDIIALTVCLNPYLTRTHLKHLCLIIFTVLAMNGRITMRGMARWAERGLSERTLSRWFSLTIDWTSLFSMVATRILTLTYQARQTPDAP
jgi:putative transposase